MKKWEAMNIIRRKYGDTIRGRHIDDMSEAQLVTIASCILERENAEVSKIEAYISKGCYVNDYYCNDYNQLCIINDCGEEEIVEY